MYSFADQIDDVKRQVGKFIPKNYEIEGTTILGGTAGVMHTNKIREIVALTHIIANLPPDMDGTLRGKVRKLILPTMDGIRDFDWDKAVSEIKAYEKKVGLFEKKKPVPSANTVGTKPKENTEKKGWLTYEERKAQPNLD